MRSYSRENREGWVLSTKESPSWCLRLSTLQVHGYMDDYREKTANQAVQGRLILILIFNIPHPLSAGSLASNSKSRWEGGGYDN